MKIYKIILSVIIGGLLFSCSNNSSQRLKIENRVSTPNTKAEILINQLRPESQYFEIDASCDISIVGKSGTQVFIPRNSFINQEGEKIKGMVDVELIEVLSIADFLVLVAKADVLANHNSYCSTRA